MKERKRQTMEQIARCLKLLLTALAAGIMICCIGYGINTLIENNKMDSAGKDLITKIPDMDPSLYNRFLFTMNVTAGNTDGNTEEFSMSGAVETWEDISHMYNLNVSFPETEEPIHVETWADHSIDIRYTDTGDGWAAENIDTKHTAKDLADIINSRNTDVDIHINDSAYTMAWVFPIDSLQLFGSMLERYTDDMDLEGYGRITAVFEPDTHEFRYFTIVISASNKERAGALLDAIFYWDKMNSKQDALQIPGDISCAVYESATGVSTDGGYDPEINPMAEKFIEVYGGSAKVTHYNDTASMHWTLEQEDMTADVTYIKTEDPDEFYEDEYTSFISMYGTAAEESEDSVYFYDMVSGQLTFLARTDNFYTKIIITGTQDMSQGDLRKPLIAYKSRLEI